MNKGLCLPPLLTAKEVSVGSIKRAEIRSFGDRLYWLEWRPQLQTNVICSLVNGFCFDITSTAYNPASRVHEYGGGAYCVTETEVVFVNAKEQTIYCQNRDGDGLPRVLLERVGCRYGDLVFDSAHSRILCVEEEHGEGVDNRLIAISLVTGQRKVIAQGRDFYAAPTVTAQGHRLAWLSWDLPHMPWQKCDLLEARLDAYGLPLGVSSLGQQNECFVEPRYSPNGVLYCLGNHTGWWNIYRQMPGVLTPVMPISADVGGLSWRLGQCHFDFLDETRLVFGSHHNGQGKLTCLDVDSGFIKSVGPTNHWWRSVCCFNGHLAALGDGVLASDRLLVINAGEAMQVVIESAHLHQSNITIGQHFSYDCHDGECARAIYYPPANSMAGPAPLLVRAHGGPVSASTGAYNAETQYWCQRGYALVDVNYRGSSGYGAEYRQGLYQRWGDLDWRDCEEAAVALVQREFIDSERIAIRGSSAGGLTALNGWRHSRKFKAVTSLYGVTDLQSLALQTHKYERGYLQWLVGDLEQQKENYLKRSPMYEKKPGNGAVMLFQGALDKVVPVDQARHLHQRLRELGHDCEYIEFADEGHGIAKAENRRLQLTAEYEFYQKVLNS